MNSWEEVNVNSLKTLLKKAGFDVSQICRSRPSCFDFTAKRGENPILLKVHFDADSFSSSEALELKVITNCFSAVSLLISKKTREKLLKEDTVYTRQDIFVVTPKTFKNIALRKRHPLIHAGPGGYYVKIESNMIKRRRQELGLSMGQVAAMTGISRRALYGYEKGMTEASVMSAYKLVKTLEIPAAEPINILEKSYGRRKCFLAKARHAIVRNSLLHNFFRRFFRWNITHIKKAPFDFVITFPKEKIVIIGAAVTKKEQDLNERVDEILSLSKVVQAYPILITEGKKPLNKNIACICPKDMFKIKRPEDLIVYFR